MFHLQSLLSHVSQSPQYSNLHFRFPSQSLCKERGSISKAFLKMSYIAFRFPIRGALPPGYPHSAPIEREMLRF